MGQVAVYLMVALCVYIALPDNTIWSGLSNTEWRIHCSISAVFWPLTLFIAVLKKILRD